MAELALGLSVLALAVSLLALARTSARAVSGPRPNVLSNLGSQGLAGAGSGWETAAGSGEASTPSAPSPAVAALVAAGRKIEAIKQYRTETGAGLKDSKDAVEAFEAGAR
jgi:ribosomal protein L7/L12